MTRVALLPSAYLPTLGGVQELTRNLALALVEGGDEVEIWAQQGDETHGTTVETLDGLTVRRFPFPLPGARPRSWSPFLRVAPRTLLDLRSAMKAFRPDLLHVQCFGPNGVYATSISALQRVPLVVTLQGETVMDDQDIFDHSTVLRTALRVALKRASVVTGCSAHALGDSERRFGLKPGAGEVVFNGVVLDTSSRPDEGGSATPGLRSTGIEGRYVLALGRVVEKKGFDLLIKAFARVADRHPDVSLAIAGDGPSLPGLRRLAEDLALADRVRLPGRLARPEVAAAMAGAEVFVMPSRLEPFGIVVLEAWRAGRPVIATSRGGPAEFVTDGEDGLLADPFDIDKLAEALDRLLTDQALRQSLGEAGRRRAGEFAWPIIADQYRQRYAAIPPPRRSVPRTSRVHG
jgi:glycogen synthase